MTSIIFLFLLCICTALLSSPFRCHPLCLPVSNHLPFHLDPSVYLSVIFSSIPLSFFHTLPFILLFLLSYLFCISLFTQDPSLAPVFLILSKPSSNLIFSFHFLCSILPLLPVVPLPRCCPCVFKFPSLVIAFHAQARSSPLKAIC